MDGICKFLMNDKNATYANNGDDIFASAEAYSKKIKDCTPTDRDRVWLQDMAKSVNMGGKGDKGDLLREVSEPANINDMVHFFPHFKVLFKLAQLGMTLTKQTSLENKLKTAQKNMDSSKVQLEA